MKYYGKITDPKDLVTKEYTDAKYSKPSAGIPASDLEQTVQNKLDKSVVISPNQPTESENKLWVDTDAGSGNSYQIPTMAEMEAAVAEIRPIMPTQSIAIPASGITAAYDIDGMTVDHRLVQWNFADNGTALAENSPPCSLEWTTYDGYFTITNNGGTTTATMQPLFLIPAFLPATTHTS